MNKRRSIIIVLGAVSLFFLLASFWWSRFAISIKSRPQPQEVVPESAEKNKTSAVAAAPIATMSTPQPTTQARQQVLNKIIASLAAPITFYGKVIDQNGVPVPDADVDYGTIDKFDSSGSKYSGKSDHEGNFSISGINGAVLTVGVGKEGYYNIHRKSNGTFAYGIGADPTRREPPTKESPAIFVLQKAGTTEPLIRLTRHVRISRNGSPTELDLQTGRNVATGSGDLRVEAWTEDEAQTSSRHYNWRCRVSVPNGGLVDRTGQFDFVAPTEGYRSSDEILMHGDSEQWSPNASRRYFLKLASNHYARVEFEMAAGGDHFFSITSYLNPTPGSRNLEFDPAKLIKAK